MSALLGAIIASSLASAGTGLVSAFVNKRAQAQANATNVQLEKDRMAFDAEQAQLQRDWEEQMSNTAYQRQITDMQQAGLNPYLAYQGNGASVPVGASAHSSGGAGVQAERLDLNGLANAISSMSNMLVMKSFMDGKLTVADNANQIRAEYNAGRATRDLSTAKLNEARVEAMSKQNYNSNSHYGYKHYNPVPPWLAGWEKNFEAGVEDL